MATLSWQEVDNLTRLVQAAAENHAAAGGSDLESLWRARTEVEALVGAEKQERLRRIDERFRVLVHEALRLVQDEGTVDQEFGAMIHDYRAMQVGTGVLTGSLDAVDLGAGVATTAVETVAAGAVTISVGLYVGVAVLAVELILDWAWIGPGEEQATTTIVGHQAEFRRYVDERVKQITAELQRLHAAHAFENDKLYAALSFIRHSTHFRDAC
jgi:hypothetical protein